MPPPRCIFTPPKGRPGHVALHASFVNAKELQTADETGDPWGVTDLLKAHGFLGLRDSGFDNWGKEIRVTTGVELGKREETLENLEMIYAAAKAMISEHLLSFIVREQ